MRTISIAICLSWFCLAASGQSGVGSLSGTLSKADHTPVAGLLVEAKNLATGVFYKATSSPKGEYAFAQLPAGAYQVLVLNMLYRPFVSKNVVVTEGQSPHLEIQLVQGMANTLGEIDAYLALNSKRQPPQGPTPRMPDGKPDFSGVWTTPGSSAFPLILSPPVDLLPWAEAAIRERLLNEVRDMPSARCLPASEALNGVFPMKYVQTRTVLVQLLEDVPAAHQVFLDGRPHPGDPEPTWKGHSIGKWDGDTLVIDTVGFNDKSWLFLMVPHTERLHVTQRLRRPDLGHLEIQTTYEDPETFKTPSKFTVVDILAPDEEVPEYVCENNQFTEHVNTK
jgi:hypothetical protein